MERRTNILREIKESKNMKVSDIVKNSRLPYSTIKAILERGAEKAGYVNVCKICTALGRTTVELEQMAAKPEYNLQNAYPSNIITKMPSIMRYQPNILKSCFLIYPMRTLIIL